MKYHFDAIFVNLGNESLMQATSCGLDHKVSQLVSHGKMFDGSQHGLLKSSTYVLQDESLIENAGSS